MVLPIRLKAVRVLPQACQLDDMEDQRHEYSLWWCQGRHLL